MIDPKPEYSGFFRRRKLRAVWRNATWMWLMTGFVSGQALPPLGITASQSVTTYSVEGSARLIPGGGAYVSGTWDTIIRNPTPTLTKSYGDTSKGFYYVSRVDANGKIIFTTALGAVTAADMHVDSAGNVFVSGVTLPGGGLYTSPGAYRSSPAPSDGKFVCKLNGADGSAAYCTWLDVDGRNGSIETIDQQGNFIAIAGLGNLGGVTPAASQGSLNAGSGKLYVMKLNPSGSALTWVARFGGSGEDRAYTATTDAAGNIYIAGETTSPDFPTTPNAVSTTFIPANPQPQSFYAKLTADGATLLFSTLGPNGERPGVLALDNANDLQVLYGNFGIFGLRRYNAIGSAILFDASSASTGIPVGFLDNEAMAVDAAGNTTVVSSVSGITAPLINPTGTCWFSNAIPIAANGYLVQIDAGGTVRQASYLSQNGVALFDDLSVNGSSLTAAAWTPFLPAGQGTLPALRILTLGSVPTVNLACIGNSATLLPSPLAAGEIVSLFGQGIGPAAPVAGVPTPLSSPETNAATPPVYRYPTALGGTSVTFDGVAAPLLYVSNNQINTVVPFGAKNTTHVCVTYLSNAPSCMDAELGLAAPGIFTIPSTSAGPAYAAAVNQDGTINSQLNPAPRGSIISLFATGLGPLSSIPADGDTVPLPLLTPTLTVMAGGVQYLDIHETFPAWAAPSWVGQAPFEIAGLSQINVPVPAYGATIWLELWPGGPSTSFGAIDAQPVQIWVK